MTGKAERVGILRGVASRSDEKDLAAIMEGLGLKVVFQELVLPFGSINTAEDFLIKEHFEAFREHSQPNLSSRVSARAFNHLVDSRSPSQLAEEKQWDSEQYRYVDAGQPVPYRDIIVRERTSVGFAPYTSDTKIAQRSQELAHFAIQAGSLVSAGPDIAQDFVRSVYAKEFVLSMVDQLAGQIAA